MDQVDDYGPESISTDFEEKTKNTRASGFTSYSLHDFGLRTEIGLGSKDYSGKSIDQHIAERMNSMRKWHSRIRVATPKERRLSNVLSKINEICSGMSLPKTITETAAMIYRNFENKNDAKGKSILCMAAATIYMACKRCSVVRSLDEIVKAGGTLACDPSTSKLASKYYRMMVMEMGIFGNQQQNMVQKRCLGAIHARNLSSSAPSHSLAYEETHKSSQADHQPSQVYANYSLSPQLTINSNSLPHLEDLSPDGHMSQTHDVIPDKYPVQARSLTAPAQECQSYVKQNPIHAMATVAIDHYISKLANNAKIDTKVERLAIDIAHKTNNHFLADGKSPHGLAAAYIYMSAALLGSSLSQVEISEIAGITEVTIRNRCKDILCNFKITIRLKPQQKE
jgi:transcription initiation factor TFIIIB Brf1 subunit/transcription initiation factor TFIIB